MTTQMILEQVVNELAKLNKNVQVVGLRLDSVLSKITEIKVEVEPEQTDLEKNYE